MPAFRYACRMTVWTTTGRVSTPLLTLLDAADEQLSAHIDQVAPIMEWETFLSEFSEPGGDFIWRQGEHVTIIGNTSSGKTTLARAILPIRRFVTVSGPNHNRIAATLCI